MTINDLIKRSLRMIGTIAGGDDPDPQEAIDALFALNSMLDAWNLENLLIYDIRTETFALTPNQASYTIGSAGNFNTVRPLKIEQALYNYNNIDYVVKLLAKFDYENIPKKDITATIPLYLYYEPAFPLGIIKFYPIPSISSNIKLVTLNQLTSVLLTDTISLPPGYTDALMYNLALALSAEFNTPNVNPIIPKQAEDLKRRIKAMNQQQLLRTVKLDSAITNNNKFGYSIYSDGYRP